MTAYCYTGSYQIPVRTLTDSITKDIMMIQETLEQERLPFLIIDPLSQPLKNLPVWRQIPDWAVCFPGKQESSMCIWVIA